MIAAKNDHANHRKPEHNSDGWIWCESCGGWVVHSPDEKS